MTACELTWRRLPQAGMQFRWGLLITFLARLGRPAFALVARKAPESLL
jgi:hypothetical protein